MTKRFCHSYHHHQNHCPRKSGRDSADPSPELAGSVELAFLPELAGLIGPAKLAVPAELVGKIELAYLVGQPDMKNGWPVKLAALPESMDLPEPEKLEGLIEAAQLGM